MRACKVCGRQYQTGKTAYVMNDRGLKAVRVCRNCAADGVLLVAARPATKCSCGRPAGPPRCHVCATGAERLEKASIVAGAAAKIKVWAGAARATAASGTGEDGASVHAMGRAEAFEAVLELLQGGRF